MQIREKLLVCGIVVENFICNKAKVLYTNFVNKFPLHQQKMKKASRQAGDGLKNRSGTHSIMGLGTGLFLSHTKRKRLQSANRYERSD